MELCLNLPCPVNCSTMDESLRCGFLAHHSYLIRKLDLPTVMPLLVQEGLVTLNEKERIENRDKSTSDDRCDALLTLVHRKAAADNNVYEKFLDVLKDERCSSGQPHLVTLANTIRNDATKEEVVRRFTPTPSGLYTRQREALCLLQNQLEDSLSVEGILPDLVTDGVVNLDDNEFIRAGDSSKDKVHRLVTRLKQKNSQQFSGFVSTLKNIDVYKKLGKRLEAEAKEKYGEIE